MKTTIKLISSAFVAIILLIQLELTAQNIARTDITLTNMDGKKVVYDDLVQTSERTIIVFWNSNNKKHIDFLDMLNEQEINIETEENLKIIAICTDRFHNYQQLKVLASSKMWDINLFVDINESFKRINGISEERLRATIYEDGEQITDPIATPDMNHRNYLVQM